MNNLEYYKDEIIDILTCAITKYCNWFVDENNRPCKVKETLRCKECKFKDSSFCSTAKHEWLLAEHKELPTITSNEKKLLELIEHGYITRDKDGEMFFTNKEPIKGSDNWFFTGFDFKEKYIDLSVFKNINFDFIKWEDEEPWVIEDLLKLEVKDD